MSTYNGFEPNESRTRKQRPMAGDQGHSIVEMTTTRVGYQFRLRYTEICQCGKKFSGWDQGDLYYRHLRHLQAVKVRIA